MGSTGSFKNDDYTYLINCDDLIKTCREALLENESSSLGENLCDEELRAQKESVSITKPERLHEPSVASPADSLAEFMAWLSHMEQRLDSACYCQNDNQLDSVSREELIAFHKSLQSQIEEIGRDLMATLSNAVERSKSLVDLSSEVTETEQRWHALWLKSLEYVMIMQHSADSCPRHFAGEPSSSQAIIHAPTETDVPNEFYEGNYDGPASMMHMNMSTASSFLALISRDLLDEIKLRELAVNMNRTGDGGSEDRTTDYSSMCGTWPSAAKKANRKKNKRIQTYCDQTTTTDARGSKGGELIHKDVGYSSDADLSDAVDRSSQSLGSTVSDMSPRRREVRRRRAKKLNAMSDKRPWSFHQGDWADWDYTDCSTGFPGSPRAYEQSSSPVSSIPYSQDEETRGSSRNSQVTFASCESPIVESSKDAILPLFSQESAGDTHREIATISTQTIEIDVEIETASEEDAQGGSSSFSAIILSFSCISFIVLLICALLAQSPAIELVYRNPPPF